MSNLYYEPPEDLVYLEPDLRRVQWVLNGVVERYNDVITATIDIPLTDTEEDRINVALETYQEIIKLIEIGLENKYQEADSGTT
jgi:hypothetical protein